MLRTISEAEMQQLLVFRSDFRSSAVKEAVLRLLRLASFKTDNVLEIPIGEAPQANAIVLRLRKMIHERETVLVIGSSKGETLVQTLCVLNEVRKAILILAVFPTIVLARRSEWKLYGQIASAPSTECFETPDLAAEVPGMSILVLEQKESYSDLTHRLVLAHIWPKKPVTDKGGYRERDASTKEFFIDGNPTGSIQRLTDEMLQKAGIDGSIKPVSEERGTHPPPPPDFIDPKAR